MKTWAEIETCPSATSPCSRGDSRPGLRVLGGEPCLGDPTTSTCPWMGLCPHADSGGSGDAHTQPTERGGGGGRLPLLLGAAFPPRRPVRVFALGRVRIPLFGTQLRRGQEAGPNTAGDLGQPPAFALGPCC